MKISVITPSVRPDQLEIVERCLKRQTFSDYEWIRVGPKEYGWLAEPPKRDGDYYSLNKAWNEALRTARGELWVSIVDGLWFPPDTLERLWSHYISNPTGVVSCIGHQYDQLQNGKPEHLVWRDPRARLDQGSFYQTSPVNMELCVAALPIAGVREVGGIDEEFDKYAALSEKELCFRLEKLGYTFFLDQALEYRAIKHDRLSSEWDERYNAGCEYYSECLRQIADGTRLALDFLK